MNVRSTTPLIDSHAHLDPGFFRKDLAAVIDESRRELYAVVTIGSGHAAGGTRHAVALAEAHDFIWATVGLHPHEAKLWDDAMAEEFEALARRPRVVAVGEAGLDYFYDRSPRELQRDAFRAQLRLAHRVGKPIVLHIRDAWPDALAILREERVQDVGGVVHCFTGDADQAEASLELGLHIGVTGIATYGHAADLRKTLERIPLDRLLVETDSPYLPAQAVRKVRPNRPALVRHVAVALAQWRSITFEELAAAATANTCRLFGIPEPQA